MEITGDFAPLTGVMRLGTNLDWWADWHPSWLFTNAFKQARTWMTGRIVGEAGYDYGGDYDTEVDVPRIDNGWPEYAPVYDEAGLPHRVHTTVPLHTDGAYRLEWSGTGHIRLPRFGEDLHSQSGDHSYSFDTTAGKLLVDIFFSDPTDPIRDLRVLNLEHLDEGTFHALFRERLAPFGVLRFMGAQRTIDTKVEHWHQRTTPETYVQTSVDGGALEYMIELANLQQSEPWFCVPHTAGDDYVWQMAELIGEQLDPALPVWVEWSNETWNASYPVYLDALAAGVAREMLEGAPNHYYTAIRSAEVWRIFEEVLGDERVISVLGTQGGNPWVTKEMFRALHSDHNPEQTMPEVLAIAPYFGKTYYVGDAPSVESIVDVDAPEAIGLAIERTEAQLNVARTHGLPLVAYEGGQHFLGTLGNTEEELAIRETFLAANRHPRMYDRYLEYLEGIEAAGVEVFVNFNYMGLQNKYGAWGALWAQDQDLETAPKYKALEAWAEE